MNIIYDYETADEFTLEDERVNLDKELGANILVIADLGLWDGRKPGYKVIGRNLKDIFNASCGDYQKIWHDPETDDILEDDIHHDGTNHYRFREIRAGVDMEPLLDAIYNGDFTEEDVAKYTKPLGKYVRKVYGWKKKKARPAKKAA